jgi:hypothetical protein
MMANNAEFLKNLAKARLKKHHKKPIKKSSAHPGFKNVQKNIAKKQGVSEDKAGAILAHSSRHASKSAKKANPFLKKVK